MGFNSYKGSIKMASGMKPEADGYPLMQSCDIQVDEEGTRLDAFLGAIPKIIPITQEDYNALASYEKDALYMIVEEDGV